MSNVDEIHALYQNDPAITVGMYARMVADAEARDACTCGQRGICTSCVIFEIESAA